MVQIPAANGRTQIVSAHAAVTLTSPCTYAIHPHSLALLALVRSAQRVIVRLFVIQLFRIRLRKGFENVRREKRRLEEEALLRGASNRIGKNWRGMRDRIALGARFVIRRKVMRTNFMSIYLLSIIL